MNIRSLYLIYEEERTMVNCCVISMQCWEADHRLCVMSYTRDNLRVYEAAKYIMSSHEKNSMLCRGTFIYLKNYIKAKLLLTFEFPKWIAATHTTRNFK